MSMTWRAILACPHLFHGIPEALHGTFIFLVSNQGDTELRHAWCAPQPHRLAEVFIRRLLISGHARPNRRAFENKHSHEYQSMPYLQAVRVRFVDSTSVRCLFSTPPLPVSVRLAERV